MSIPDIINGITNLSKIKLRGGLVGKVCLVMIVFCVCLTVIAVVYNNFMVACVVIGVLTLVVSAGVWKVVSFAGKNPEAALSEGAEFLVHERLLYGMKGVVSSHGVHYLVLH